MVASGLGFTNTLAVSDPTQPLLAVKVYTTVFEPDVAKDGSNKPVPDTNGPPEKTPPGKLTNKNSGASFSQKGNGLRILTFGLAFTAI